MATASEGADRKKAALTDVTSILYMEILTLDLVVNILCRLPVKVLMKVRCVCKSWNSLISDPKFAKDHFRLSRTLLNRHHLLLCRQDTPLMTPIYSSGIEFLLLDSPLPSVFNSASTTIPVETQRLID